MKRKMKEAFLIVRNSGIRTKIEMKLFDPMQDFTMMCGYCTKDVGLPHYRNVTHNAVNCRIARQIDRQLAKLSPAPLLGLAPGMNFESAQSANCGCSRPRPKKTAERKKTPDENPPHENLRRKSPAEKKERNEFHSSTSFDSLSSRSVPVGPVPSTSLWSRGVFGPG